VNPIESFHGGYIHSRRVRRLADWFARLLPENATVLDVGSGDGRLAQCVLQRRDDLRVRGVEVAPREGCAIPVERFDGVNLPFEDDAFDAVLISDVLHHAAEPERLLREASRVARSIVVIKDHLRKGLLAAPTLRLMDQVGNRRFGVPVRADYWPEDRWRTTFQTCGLDVDQWERRLQLYPWWLNWWFGRSLHFVARLKKRKGGI
jgi:SAM-dependent methyltransferase